MAARKEIEPVDRKQMKREMRDAVEKWTEHRDRAVMMAELQAIATKHGATFGTWSSEDAEKLIEQSKALLNRSNPEALI